MTQQASSPIQNDASLEALLETERRLEQQLGEARRQADERVKQAREAQDKEQELARTLAGLEAFRADLSARMLAEVLGR